MLEKEQLDNMRADIKELNLSLAGCGYLGIYHVGVASCMRKYCPQILKNKISGASAGALIAAAFICDAPLESCTLSVINVVLQVRHGILGPITPDLDIMTLLYENMSCVLPEDAHLYCSGKLHVSVTRYDDCQNVLLSQFDSKEDLMQALMCSCFIPVYCGFDPPMFHGVAYCDGGYSNNCPKLNPYTVTVSPFFGETDICPKDKLGEFRTLMMNGTSIFLTMENCCRLLRVLFPGPPDTMKTLCQAGFDDSLLFLRNNGLIDCPDCCSETNGNQVGPKASHEKCKPFSYPIPQEISTEMDAAVERLHSGIGQRLMKNPIVKMLYYVNMPSIFTAKVSYSLFSAIARKLQNKANSCLDNASSKPCRAIVNGRKDGSPPVNSLKPYNDDIRNGNDLCPETLKATLDKRIKGQESDEEENILRVTLEGEDAAKKEYTLNGNDVFQVTDICRSPRKPHVNKYFVLNTCEVAP